METKIVKRRKISFKKLLIILLVFYLLGCFIYYLIKLPIQNIYIKGTSSLSDATIIEAGNLKNYPSIFKLKSSDLKKKIEALNLVGNVKIKKDIFGKLTIEIEENKVLFINRGNGKVILSNGSEVENANYYGIPILLNVVPDEILENFINGLKKIDYDIILLISEIQYDEYKSGDVVIDDSRFLLRMNDGNHVYINIVNIAKFNNYPKIYSELAEEDWGKGVVYLDSSDSTKSSFQSFKAIEEAKKKGEEAKAEDVPIE